MAPSITQGALKCKCIIVIHQNFEIAGGVHVRPFNSYGSYMRERYGSATGKVITTPRPESVCIFMLPPICSTSEVMI